VVEGCFDVFEFWGFSTKSTMENLMCLCEKNVERCFGKGRCIVDFVSVGCDWFA
jgi:hypothetical protein